MPFGDGELVIWFLAFCRENRAGIFIGIPFNTAIPFDHPVYRKPSRELRDDAIRMYLICRPNWKEMVPGPQYEIIKLKPDLP